MSRPTHIGYDYDRILDRLKAAGAVDEAIQAVSRYGLKLREVFPPNPVGARRNPAPAARGAVAAVLVAKGWGMNRIAEVFGTDHTSVMHMLKISARGTPMAKTEMAMLGARVQARIRELEERVAELEGVIEGMRGMAEKALANVCQSGKESP